MVRAAAGCVAEAARPALDRDQVFLGTLLKKWTDYSVPDPKSLICLRAVGVDRAVCPLFQQDPSLLAFMNGPSARYSVRPKSGGAPWPRLPTGPPRFRAAFRRFRRRMAVGDHQSAGPA